jgi:hypothetical protein
LTFEGTEYLEKGQRAEQYAHSLLVHSFPDCQIIDVRENQKYQHEDIDYLVIGNNGTEKRIEVKYDRYLDRGNFCFEVMRIRHNTKNKDPLYIGWSIRTNTHVLLMWHDYSQRMYVVYHWALVEGLQRYTKEQHIQKQRINAQTVFTDNFRTTLNIYIPQRLVRYYIFEYRQGEWVKCEDNNSTS